MALLRIRTEQIHSQDRTSTLSEQLAGMGKPYYKVVVATDGMKTITLEKPYTPKSGELQVYLNGLKVSPTSDPSATDGDYAEIDQHTIEFVEALQDGDVVEFRMEGKGQGVAMVVDHFHAYKEVPSGVVDGRNRVFLLSRTPRPNTELVFVNGQLKNPGPDNDYTMDNNKIIFNEPPAAGSVILVNYDLAYIG